MKLPALWLPLVLRRQPNARKVVRRSRRAARRTLGFALGFVLLIHFAVIVSMETVKPEWRDPEFGYRLRNLRALQASAPERPLVVALGSSRTQMDLSPASMPIPDGGPIVFNLGRSGAGPIRLAMNLQRLRSAGVRPNAVLIEFMPSTFHTETVSDVAEKMAPMLSHADVELLVKYTDDSTKLRRAWAWTRMNSLYTSRLTLMSHLQSGWLPWPVRQDYLWTVVDRYGWMPYVKETVQDAEREKQLNVVEANYFPILQDLHIHHPPEQALRDIIACCQKDGVRVALYVMPESPRFRSWYSPEAERRSRALLDAIAKETGVPVFDASSGFAETDFVDGHHMLRGAAAVFSERLWRDHLQPWLAK